MHSALFPEEVTGRSRSTQRSITVLAVAASYVFTRSNVRPISTRSGGPVLVTLGFDRRR
jgi:hypothetical protein